MIASSTESVVIDIGGTNARFGFVDRARRLSDVTVLKCADFEGVESAIEAYVRGKQYRLRTLSLAVACPIDHDRIQCTNNHWGFSKRSLLEQLGLDRLRVVNDFTAQSIAAATLSAVNYQILQHGVRPSGAAVLVIGPGTGLGVGGVVSDDNGTLIPIVSEGGHVTLSGQTARELMVIEYLARTLGHVSAERCVSGPGLIRIYEALCEIDGADMIADSPQGLMNNFSDDPRARETLDIFAGFLGTVASDACLTLGARGGVVIAGGVIPKLDKKFPYKVFLDRFCSKGRFSDYLSDVEVKVMLNTEAALTGLANLHRIRGMGRYETIRQTGL